MEGKSADAIIYFILKEGDIERYGDKIGNKEDLKIKQSVIGIEIQSSAHESN